MSRYKEFYDCFLKAHPHITKKAQLQVQCNDVWRSVKADSKAIDAKIQEWTSKALASKAKLFSYWSQQIGEKSHQAARSPGQELAPPLSCQNTLIPSGATSASSIPSSELSLMPLTTENFESNRSSDQEDVDDPGPQPKKPRTRPAQDAATAELQKAKDFHRILLIQRDSGLVEISHKEIKKAEEKVKNLEASLGRMKNMCVWNKTAREKQRSRLKAIQTAHPEEAAGLLRGKPGRPPLEENQHGLLKAIRELAVYGASADERRRCESLRACRTLDQLVEELQCLGFHLSRTATYLRLLPRNSSTTEGKRHIRTVPVRLRRAECDLRKLHQDTIFCKASISHLFELAAILAICDVLVLSVDDKCRVPIGLTAATKQSPILMHLVYRVRLPDHDFVKAARHKLIPSVYAVLQVVPGTPGDPKRVTYSGPTFIAVRSAKHDSSTASSHAFDLDTLVAAQEFEAFTQVNGVIKSVWVITSDGGPDENPRYEKVQEHTIETFRKYDLDAIFLATNAAGRSAYNAVEQRMAPLSRQLAGLLLLHDTYRSHLDSSGRTIDSDLEMKNFTAAGNLLAEVWDGLRIDDHQVVARFTPPGSERIICSSPSTSGWRDAHMRCSQYVCQIVKCDDRSCCGPWRSSLKTALPDRFLPPPVPVADGIIPDIKNGKYLSLFATQVMQHTLQLPELVKEIKMKCTSSEVPTPYDAFLPTLLNDKKLFLQRVCLSCGIYHCSAKSLQKHNKGTCQVQQSTPTRVTRARPIRIVASREQELMVIFRNEEREWVEKEDLDLVNVPETTITNESVMPVLKVKDAVEPVWEDEP